MDERTIARFWARVEYEPNSGCWLWTGAPVRKGYGRIHVGGRRPKGRDILAHRFSWAVSWGPIPNGAWVLHRCDNPPCVNPDHLFLGDHVANMADMAAKGRAVNTPHRGEEQIQAKLSDSAVNRIRTLYASGQATQRGLAAQYGVSKTLIGNVVRGENWNHVAPPLENAS